MKTFIFLMSLTLLNTAYAADNKLCNEQAARANTALPKTVDGGFILTHASCTTDKYVLNLEAHINGGSLDVSPKLTNQEAEAFASTFKQKSFKAVCNTLKTQMTFVNHIEYRFSDQYSHPLINLVIDRSSCN